MENIDAKPFLQWAGGKSKTADTISKYFPPEIDRYYELFLGGGAIYFYNQHRINRAELSDFNRDLIITYQVIRGDIDGLIEILLKHKRNHNKEYFYQIRGKHNLSNFTEIAGRFIYLNQTCFNGLYRVDKNGHFNTSFGRDDAICEPVKLKGCSEVLQDVKISCKSFEKARVHDNSVVYCDPPYDGSQIGYVGRFTQNDHKRLKDCAVDWYNRGCDVFISNSATPFIKDLYKEYTIIPIKSRTTFSSDNKTRGAMNEILIVLSDKVDYADAINYNLF